MSLNPALPTLALALASCATQPKVHPIPVLAETRPCPAYPLPPAGLLKPPAKLDYLPKTH